MNNLNSYPEIYMPCPFAGEADAGGTDGTNRSKPFSDSKSNANVNMRTGFPSVFTLAQSANGKYLSRPDMNQLGYLATVGQFRRQIGCLNEFNSTFAGTIGGYANGAVLDYVEKFGTEQDSPVKQVWKIVSLKEHNSTVPTSGQNGTIANFNTPRNELGSKSWLKIVPDADYLAALEMSCHSYTDDEVRKEKARAEGVESQKINTDTAKSYFAAGGKSTNGLIDGTARDAGGNVVKINHTRETASAAGIPIQSTRIGGVDYDYVNGGGSVSPIQGQLYLAKSGHVHTNMYTKAEVDAKIQSMGGEFAAGSDQTSGYHDGTYRNLGGQVKGHKHDESAECFKTINYTSGNITFHPHDGTAHDSSGAVTNSEGSAASGHVHTNYATTDDVNSLTNKINQISSGHKIVSGRVTLSSQATGSVYYGSVTLEGRINCACANLVKMSQDAGVYGCYITFSGRTLTIYSDFYYKDSSQWPSAQTAHYIAILD